MAAPQDVPNTLELTVYHVEQTASNTALTHPDTHGFLDLL